jgi:ribonuclease J
MFNIFKTENKEPIKESVQNKTVVDTKRTYPPRNNNRRPSVPRNMESRSPERNKVSNFAATPIKIIPISGVEGIGANCTAFQYGNDIIVVDAGLGFPDESHLGIDSLIPNPKFLEENKGKIKALFITHGHLDHIGGIPYLIESMGFPDIYASDFARGLIENSIQKYHSDVYPKVTFRRVDTSSQIRMGNFKISYFAVNHSIPESMGMVIETPSGVVVHTGDFKFDSNPVNEPHADYAKLANIGSRGVLCLLSDSTNSFKMGHSLSESEIAKRLEDVIEDINGRVIIATFSSMVNRLIQLMTIAERVNRKVFISGKSMENAIKVARKLGYLKVRDELFIKAEQLKNYQDNQIMILATGAQGEDLSALKRMATNEHKNIKIRQGDTVLLSASVIPGNDLLVQNMVDQLYVLGANVHHNDILDLHASGHGYSEDQKLMINLVKPKYFMPVHGFQSFLFQHGKSAVEVGVKPENVIVPQNGSIIEVSSRGWRRAGKTAGKQVNISGSIVGDVGNIILDERKQLANYGVVIINMVINRNTRKLVQNPRMTTRGFIFMKDNYEMINNALKMLKEAYEVEGEKLDEKMLSDLVSRKLGKYFYKFTEREPLILTMVTYI